MTPETVFAVQFVSNVMGLVYVVGAYRRFKAMKRHIDNLKADLSQAESLSEKHLSALNVAVQACADKDATIGLLTEQRRQLRAELATHEQRKAAVVAQCKANASAGGKAAAAKRRELKGENHA